MVQSFSVRLSQLVAVRSVKTYRLLFEEHEERIIMIVVWHVGSARLALRRGNGIEGSLSVCRTSPMAPSPRTEILLM